MANYNNALYSYNDVLNGINNAYFMRDDSLRYSAGVKTMQEKFNYAGYNCGVADGKFGSGTEKVVREFQADQFIGVDGKAGQNTISRLEYGYDNARYSYSDILNSNSAYYARDTKLRRSSGVETMQRKLNAAGYTCGIDGQFGAGTASAVKRFQSAHGLSIDGRAGRNTLLALDNSENGGGSNVSGLVYASTAQTNSTLTTTQMTANAHYVLSYLKQKGFTKQAACAVIGNMQAESDVDPGVWEVRNRTSSGYGLVQWTPGTKFLSYASSKGYLTNTEPETVNSLALNNPKQLMNAELEFLVWSCLPGNGHFFPPAPSMQHTAYSMTFNAFKQSTMSVDTLAIIFHDHYERSSDSDDALNRRRQYAVAWFNKL